MTHIPTLYEWLMAAGMLVTGICAGIFADKILLPNLKKLSSRTKWKGDDAVITALHGYCFPAGVLVALHAVALYLPLSRIILHYIERGLYIGAVVLVTLFVSRLVVQGVSFLNRGSQEMLPSTSILLNLAKAIVFILGLLFILESFGVSIAPILTALGVGGLAVALALQDTLSNLFSGLHILMSKKIRPGDYIKMDTINEGFVTDITWRETTIKTLTNSIIIIPNAKVAAALVINYTLVDKEVAVQLEIGVAYTSNLNNVERVTIETAQEIMRTVAGGVPDSMPTVRFHTFGESSIDCTVTMRAKEFADLRLVRHEFVKKLQQNYLAEGIEIPFPVRTVLLNTPESGETTR